MTTTFDCDILNVGGGKSPGVHSTLSPRGSFYIRRFYLEITIVYQDRQITLTRPEIKYGSNIQNFREMVEIAFAGIGLVFEGTILEIGDRDE